MFYGGLYTTWPTFDKIVEICVPLNPSPNPDRIGNLLENDVLKSSCGLSTSLSIIGQVFSAPGFVGCLTLSMTLFAVKWLRGVVLLGLFQWFVCQTAAVSGSRSS